MKTPENLPKWFSLEKYQDTESLSPHDWYSNLLVRQQFLYSWQIANDQTQPSDIRGVFKNRANAVIEELKVGPIFKNAQLFRTASSDMDEVLTNFDASIMTQQLARRLSDLDAQKARIIVVHATRYDNQRTRNFLQRDSKDGSNFGCLSVNLNANKRHIIAEVTKWVDEIRKERTIPANKRPFRASDYKEWSEYSILPYLDLKIWEEWTGHKITQAVKGRAIFPGETVDSTERLRKTTTRKANKLMLEATLDGFLAQLSKDRVIKPT